MTSLLMNETPTDSTESRPDRVCLACMPRGARARVIEVEADDEQCATLSAMGLCIDEEVVIHQAGEPTIVSLQGGRGRRIGLSLRVARCLHVVALS